MHEHTRLTVTKTYKLFIGGAFPRSESGRTTPIHTAEGPAHVARASRKDLRDAVEAAHAAQPAWARATPYLRGQVLYRLAEMMEGKASELTAALRDSSNTAINPSVSTPTNPPAIAPDHEVALAIDRVVHYAGWADKHAHVLGGANPVAGPYHNFTIPEPMGVVAVACPDEAPLLALVSLALPAVCAGNAVVALATEAQPIAACVLAEAIATSDTPPGIFNILTGSLAELSPHLASHREIMAIHAANLSPQHAASLRAGAAENLKRVTIRAIDDWRSDACESPWWIEPLVELKTMWHPSGA